MVADRRTIGAIRAQREAELADATRHNPDLEAARTERDTQLAAIRANADPATVAIIEAGIGAPPDHELAPHYVDWADMWAQDPAESDWLVEPLIARARSHALYAGAKSGKSLLVLAACAALATGRPFLDKPAGEPVHVVYLDYEMTEEDLRERLEAFGYGPGDDLSHLHYALLPTIPGLDTVDGGNVVTEAAWAINAALVVIDTTARAVGGDENDADTIRAFYRHTGLALKQMQVAWIRIDHAGKDVERGQRGSSAKNDDVDIVWRYARVDGGAKLEATHSRVSWVPRLVELVVAEDDDGHWVIDRAGQALWPAGTKEIAAVLDELGVAPDASYRQARKALREAGRTATSTILAAGVKWRKSQWDGCSVIKNGTVGTPDGGTVEDRSGPEGTCRSEDTEHQTERSEHSHRVNGEQPPPSP